MPVVSCLLCVMLESRTSKGYDGDVVTHHRRSGVMFRDIIDTSFIKCDVTVWCRIALVGTQK